MSNDIQTIEDAERAIEEMFDSFWPMSNMTQSKEVFLKNIIESYCKAHRQVGTNKEWRKIVLRFLSPLEACTTIEGLGLNELEPTPNFIESWQCQKCKAYCMEDKCTCGHVHTKDT